MSPLSRRRRGADEGAITLTVRRIEEVFAAPAIAAFPVSVELPTRIEEVIDELLTRRADEPVRLTVELTEQEPSAAVASELEAAIGAYCEVRIRQARRSAHATWRHGLESLPIGIVVLLLGLVGSELLRHTDLPEFVRVFFGDGVFILVAWVALWYPLDQLVYYWRPHVRERRTLEALRDAPLTVRAGTRTD